ncbi:MAG TPA: MFS transporter, partial [Pseudogracilibacillus sp.]|nr:MFS transporter [Pseudogracilibacillus sp.]
ITNYGVNGVTAALFSFGLGAAIGNFLSGRIPMNYLTSGLIFSLSGLALVLAIFTFLIQNPISALIIVFLFGLGAFGTIPILQTKMITGAKEAPTLAATSAASAFNVANAVGAWLGGVLLSNGFSFLVISLAGALITVIGLIITLFSKYTVKQ